MVDGKSCLRSLRQALNEVSDSDFLDDRISYEYIWQAAIEFVSRTNALTSTQSITTVANQAEYTLNADFLKLYLKNRDNNFYIKYNDGSAVSFPLFKEKQEIIFQNSTASVDIPSKFYIEDDPTLDTQITGTETVGSVLSGGQCTLTDTSSTTKFADVSAGDIVNNTTDSSSGYVLSKTSNTVLAVALFDGTDNDCDLADAYVIQPQSRLRLVLSPPPSTSSHTITVPYVQRPAPVFSDYGIYRFGLQHLQAIVFFAIWLYKYRDKDSSLGDKYYKFFDAYTRKSAVQLNDAFLRQNFKVNFKKRI